MEKKTFCQHCSEQVLTYTVVREGREEICCLYCGLPLEKIEKHTVAQKRGATAAIAGKILYADDSPFMRELLNDIISNNNITESFLSFEDGEKLLYNYTKALVEKENIGVVILDIKMPFISGIGTGVAIRAVEKALAQKPAPLLYFSVKQADEELKKLIAHTTPSYYLNKGASGNVQELEKRLVLALKSILKL